MISCMGVPIWHWDTHHQNFSLVIVVLDDDHGSPGMCVDDLNQNESLLLKTHEMGLTYSYLL